MVLHLSLIEDPIYDFIYPVYDSALYFYCLEQCKYCFCLPEKWLIILIPWTEISELQSDGSYWHGLAGQVSRHAETDKHIFQPPLPHQSDVLNFKVNLDKFMSVRRLTLFVDARTFTTPWCSSLGEIGWKKFCLVSVLRSNSEASSWDGCVRRNHHSRPIVHSLS